MPRRLAAVPETAPRAVLYLRQSITREESISLALQERACRDYCARMGYEVVDILQDPNRTGRTWDRVAVKRAMAMLEGREADVVVLWRWSRLSRNRRDWALAADRADSVGGLIESATEPNEVATAAGRFQRGVMIELAAFESERIGEQWKEVQSARVDGGTPPGRLPFGWRYEDKRVVPDGERGQIVREMFDRYLAGWTAGRIADWLNKRGIRGQRGGLWNQSNVRHCMESPTHCGMLRYRGTLREAAHDGVITVEQWNKFLALRTERSGKRPAQFRYLLSGLLTCAKCGSGCTGITVPDSRGGYKWIAYRCTRSATKGTHHAGPGQMTAKLIEPAVLDFLVLLSTDVDEATKNAPQRPLSDTLDEDRLAREITALDQQLVKLTGHLAAGLVPETAYRKTRDDIENRRAIMARELEAIERRKAVAPKNAQQVAMDLVRDWEILPITERRDLIRSLQLDIVVDFTDKTTTVTPRWRPL